MRITWKDGITTLIAAGAVVLERAYFHNWDWPLISNTRWTIAGLAILVVAGLVFGFALDKRRGVMWMTDTVLLGLAVVTLTTLGMIYAASDYAVLLMINAVLVWFLSIVQHLSIPSHTPLRPQHY